jgi:hypothetical protein
VPSPLPRWIIRIFVVLLCAEFMCIFLINLLERVGPVEGFLALLVISPVAHAIFRHRHPVVRRERRPGTERTPVMPRRNV